MEQGDRRLPKETLSQAFVRLMVDADDHTQDAARMVKEGIINGLGALDDEGAFTVASPFISEEESNAR